MAMNATTEPVFKTLQTLALEAATNKDLFQFIIDWWGRLLQTMHWSHLLKRLSDTELEQFSRSLPWDHPAARDMDFQLHKRRTTSRYIVLIDPLSDPLCPIPLSKAESNTILRRFVVEFIYGRDGYEPWKDGKMHLRCTDCSWKLFKPKELPINRRCVGCDFLDYLLSGAD